MLKGKSAIVTGGARGIGKAIAIELAKKGANVAITYRSNDQEAEKTKEELEKLGTKIKVFKGDICDSNVAKETVSQTKEAFGAVDILVNNAGITNDKLILRMGEDDFNQVVNTNLSGSFYFLKECAKVMVKQKSGRIINITSVAGVKGNPGQINYSAAKAGVIGMTLSAAKELGKRGITVNAIAPGFIETDMTAILTEEQKEKALENITLGRLGKAEEVGKLVVFLSSEGAGYITGQTIGIDGGIIL